MRIYKGTKSIFQKISDYSGQIKAQGGNIRVFTTASLFSMKPSSTNRYIKWKGWDTRRQRWQAM